MESNKKAKCSWCQNCTTYVLFTSSHKISNQLSPTSLILLKVMISIIFTRNNWSLWLQLMSNLSFPPVSSIHLKTNRKKTSTNKKNSRISRITSQDRKKQGISIQMSKRMSLICSHHLKISRKSNASMLKMREWWTICTQLHQNTKPAIKLEINHRED